MRLIDPLLGIALAVSLLLHGLLLASSGWLQGPERRARARLEVELQAAPPAAPPLLMDEAPRLQAAPRPPRAAARPETPGATAATLGPSLAGEAAREANAQMARELLYPPEAIARGLEGEALVMLFLDGSGNAIAARLEASSGHPLLDEAAVRAARTLRGLPASAPREALLPVRFRLR